MKRAVCLLLIFALIASLISCDITFGGGSINGVSLKDYSIVYSENDYDYAKRAAEYIQTEILERTKVVLPLVTDETEVKAHEIVVGNTNRAISTKLNAETEGLEFAILADGGHIALEAEYFIIAAAAYFFIETYVPALGFEATVPEQVSIHSPIVEKANNFILLIGDGMGPVHTKSFQYLENDRDYSDGEDIFYGYLFPYQGKSRTASLSGVTDSAAGGTALACGIKTINTYIGRDQNQKDVKSLTELAYELNMAAGVMSTESKTGATPASFSAHAEERSDSSEIILSQVEARDYYGTIIDCGDYKVYDKRYTASIEKHITDTLDKLDDNENGFFLMYEEAQIDKHSHNNDMDNMFNAVVRFNQAIARFMEYAFYNPDTMVIITADHETGNLLAGSEGKLAFHSTQHSGANVQVFAYGYGAEVFNNVTIENIQIAHTIAHFMGVDDFGDQSKYQYLGK